MRTKIENLHISKHSRFSFKFVLLIHNWLGPLKNSKKRSLRQYNKWTQAYIQTLEFMLQLDYLPQTFQEKQLFHHDNSWSIWTSITSIFFRVYMQKILWYPYWNTMQQIKKIQSKFSDNSSFWPTFSNFTKTTLILPTFKT